MKLPQYLTTLNLAALPVDYVWENVTFNGFWATSDDDSPRLAAAIQLIDLKAAYALGVAAAEWVVARVEGHTDTADALLRIEAAWAAAADWRYANLPLPGSSPASAPKQFAGPLRCAMKLLAHAWMLLRTSSTDLYTRAQALIMLVDHIAGRHPAVDPWVSESLRRGRQHYARSALTVEQQAPVPPEFFEPNFVFTQEAAARSLERFLGQLVPAANPYLLSADDMRAAGFPGVPYGPPP